MTTAPLLEQLRRHTTSHIRQDDLNEVARRALVRILALCAWQLSHDGQFPDRLELPAPQELSFLPDDPYSGQQFSYTQTQGQHVPPLHSAPHAAPPGVHTAKPGT